MLRTVTVSGTSEVTLWTSETGGARLRVTLSQPGVAKVTETSSGKPYLRVFRITGLKTGHAMLEAKSARGDNSDAYPDCSNLQGSHGDARHTQWLGTHSGFLDVNR